MFSVGSVRQSFFCIRCARQHPPPQFPFPLLIPKQAEGVPPTPWSPISSVPPHRWASILPDAFSSCLGKSQALGLLSQTPSQPQLLEAHISNIWPCPSHTLSIPLPLPSRPPQGHPSAKGPQEESRHEEKKQLLWLFSCLKSQDWIMQSLGAHSS